MTARETTLGALTAADLGKRVVVEGRISTGALVGIYHTDADNSTLIWLRGGTALRGPSTAPVTVYDECVPDRPAPAPGDGPCHMTFPHPPHRWDREDRTHLRWECPGVQHDEEEA